MQQSQNAIEIALRLNWSRLFRYATALTGSADEAHDLLQQSALNALASSSVPGDQEAARAWLFKIIRNAWIDRYRRRKVRSGEDLPVATEDEGWGYENRLIAEITVRQGLSKIDPMEREVIELVDLWGFKYVDAAVILDIPVGTVMSRLSRARLSLLDAIAEGNVKPIELLRASRK